MIKLIVIMQEGQLFTAGQGFLGGEAVGRFDEECFGAGGREGDQ